MNELIDIEVLYENAPCGYFSFLPDGKLIRANKTFHQWVGTTNEEITNYKFIDFLYKGNSIYYEMIFLPMLKMQGFLNEINFDIIKKDGSTFPGLINAMAVRDDSYNLIAINVTLFNITDRKKYENELLRARKSADLEKLKFEIFSNQIPDIIWTTKDSGQLEFLNNQYRKYTGIKNPVEQNIYLSDLIYEKDILSFRDKWEEAKDANTPFEIEVRLKTENPKPDWYLMRGLPLVLDSFSEEEVRSWLGTFTNINQQIKSLQLKDDFLSIASHELKTPITIVNSCLQILHEVVKDETQKKLLEKCENSMDTMQALINNLLDITHINQEELLINQKKENLAEIVRTCVDNYEDVQRKYRIELKIEMDPVYVMVDKLRIFQVINNLLSNAIKYSPDSEIVNVYLKESGGKAQVMVEDYGMGISKEDLPKIFDRYYRVKKRNNSFIKGWGLGLYIIQQIIKAHNSKIEVDSELGKGSCFYFALDIVE